MVEDRRPAARQCFNDPEEGPVPFRARQRATARRSGFPQRSSGWET
jgi:hypothetical protein